MAGERQQHALVTPAVDSLAHATSAQSPDTAWMLPDSRLVADLESAFTPLPPVYGGLRYTADWWERHDRAMR